MKYNYVYSFDWKGKLISINRYLKARTIKRNGKYIPIVYSSTEYNNLVEGLSTEMFYLYQGKTIDYKVDMYLFVTRWEGSDTGNIEKPISDALQQAKIIENDKLIRNINIIRDYHGKGDIDIMHIRLIPALGDNSLVKKEFGVKDV